MTKYRKKNIFWNDKKTYKGEKKIEEKKMEKGTNSKKMEPIKNNGIKANVAKDLVTMKNKLTSNDRRLIKAYFGYIAVKNIHHGKRTEADSCAYVRAVLWPKDLTEHEKNEESQEFDLQSYARTRRDQDIPQIFPQENDYEDLKKIFEEGVSLTDDQQAGVVRTFQVIKKKKHFENFSYYSH